MKRQINSAPTYNAFKMMLMATLVSVPAAFALLYAGTAQALIAFEFQRERAVIVEPAGYQLIQIEVDFLEWVPTGQNADTWTEYISVIINKAAPIAQLYARGVGGFFEPCAAAGRWLVDFGTAIQNGFPTAEWLQGCASFVSGPSKERPEIDIVKVIQGRDVDLVVMKAFRYTPSDAEIQSARRTLDGLATLQVN